MSDELTKFADEFLEPCQNCAKLQQELDIRLCDDANNTAQSIAQSAEIVRLKALVYRMSIINPNGYPEPMEKMIADIYNERQRQADEEYEQEKDNDS
jgi:hypothetical protein